MNQPSQDGRTTIDVWTRELFEWHYETQLSATGVRSGALEDHDEDGCISVCTSPGNERCFLPPEALRWLSGERTPPPQPIQKGDRVRFEGSTYGNDFLPAVVHHVHGGRAWIQWGDGEGMHQLAEAARLRRVGDEQ